MNSDSQNRPEISVITPFHNAGKTILPLLNCFARQDAGFPWEVVFVDNRSTDNTLRLIDSFDGPLPAKQLLTAKDKLSAAYARNQGIRACRAPVVVFCDADDEIPDSWIRKMRDGVDKYDFIGCAINDRKLNPSHMHGIMHTSEDSLLNYGYLDYSFTGAIGIRKSILESVGGFDESMRFSQDVDLCFRVQLTGHRMHFWPETEIWYRLRGDLPGWMRQAFRWCRAGKVMSRRFAQYGHSPIYFNRRQLASFLKYGLIFVLRLHDSRKRLIYGKLVAQNLAFMLPLKNEGRAGIMLDPDQIDKTKRPWCRPENP